jgi:type I restriction enzyme S subunit
MAGEWSETTIGELLANDGGSVKTGPFGTTLKAKEYSKNGVPLISVGEVGYGSLRVHERTPRAPREVVERLPEYVLEAGDIVFGRKGAVDRSALVKPEQAGWFLGSDGIRLRLPTTCDARFMAYQLQSEGSRSWLLQHATGTTMASLNQAIIERVPIVFPPRAEQRAIAHILGTLDDKIELNRRINETLEAMARALFKSWFVDFDPVRAKAEGRDPGLPQPLADLFPDSFEDSEMGEIPTGWEVKPLPELFSVNPTRRLRKGDVAPYLDMSSMPTNGHSARDVIYRPFGSGTRFVNGDTLVARITPCLENGKTAYVDFLEDRQVGWGSTEYIVMRPQSLPTEFAYFLHGATNFEISRSRA